MLLDSDLKQNAPFVSRRKARASRRISSRSAASIRTSTILRSRLHGLLRPPSGSTVAAKKWKHCAYIALPNAHAIRKPLQQAYTETEQKLANAQELFSKEREKVLSLQQENEQLRLQKDQFGAMKAEVRRLQGLDKEIAHLCDVNPKDLETFLANKSAIRHYLKLVPMLVE
ncbi:hypothetical protein IG631_19579 [Alternaria alternata]|nr:hypothetical protein IG631_19579 [Alternaria alternata]